MGSSLPKLGNSLQGTGALNPLFASVLIPVVLIVLLLGNPNWKWFAVGSTLGIAACLTISAIYDPAVWGLGDGNIARIFLIVNALLCYGLVRLALKDEKQTA